PGAPGSPFFWANLGNGVGHYAFRRSRVVEIESEWTARDRDFQNVRWSQPDLSLPQVSVQKKDPNPSTSSGQALGHRWVGFLRSLTPGQTKLRSGCRGLGAGIVRGVSFSPMQR